VDASVKDKWEIGDKVVNIESRSKVSTKIQSTNGELGWKIQSTNGELGWKIQSMNGELGWKIQSMNRNMVINQFESTGMFARQYFIYL